MTAALFVVAITPGLRPGELRALRWDHLDLEQGVAYVWCSTRRDGDTKTPQSRRLAHAPQASRRSAQGESWRDHGMVFCHEDGTPYSWDALSWRFGRVTRQIRHRPLARTKGATPRFRS
jgi:integrase